LANTTIRNAETKDFKQISKELKDSTDKLRMSKNKEHNQKLSIINLLPTL
jgi:hypothetical protein